MLWKRSCCSSSIPATSENGKLAALTSGRPAFQQHAKRTEGSDTTPRLAHSESTERRVYKPQLRQKRKDHAAQRGRDAFGTATRISASLLRRLSAFFRSVSDQDPKAAKYAVLTPGHAGFPKRVERSEGSDSGPVRKAPVSACVPLCAILLAKASVYPPQSPEANVRRLCRRC